MASYCIFSLVVTRITYLEDELNKLTYMYTQKISLYKELHSKPGLSNSLRHYTVITEGENRGQRPRQNYNKYFNGK